MVEFSPATREARVRFPASAELPYASFVFQIFFSGKLKSPLVTSERAQSDVQALVVQW